MRMIKDVVIRETEARAAGLGTHLPIGELPAIPEADGASVRLI